ncbi:hypothetical protein M436DRAFT_24100, partial [Aureobasidium namibiae CBS 147.97]
KPREWRMAISDQEYLISTELNSISHDFVNNAYSSEDMYWAKAMPAAILRNMLSNSLVMGLYALEQVGFARFVTDHVTVFYLTDVYVEPDSRGKGLGKWLISCCREILDSKPHLMRAMLMASPGEGKEFYAKSLGM